MKKYALLVALTIAPSLAHDNLAIEGLSHEVSKPKSIAYKKHSQGLVNQNGLNEKTLSEEDITKIENLEALIAKAEKTIEDIEKNHHNNNILKDNKQESADNESNKFSFNKWSEFNPSPNSNYISGGSAGSSGVAGASSSGGTSGGVASSDKKKSDGNNPATHDGGLSATAVPEPEVYLMFLAGLGLVGYRAKKYLLK